MHILGIDIGGSGIKGAVVDTLTGKFVAERYRVETPRRATPRAMAERVRDVARHFSWKGRIGCGMPGPIKHGRVLTANNLHRSWIGTGAAPLFAKATGCKVTVTNDADAAGIAEMKFGAGKGRSGVVVIVTLGTGIGSALFINGVLVPNTELGQIELRGKNAELRASARVREEKDLPWKKWANGVNEYLSAVEYLLWPDLIIIGGGVSKKSEKFIPYLKIRTPVVPARLKNDAGIIGAALSTL
jgi:polyphosphate glucokinase